MKRNGILVSLALCLLLFVPLLATSAHAADLDEILDYEITVNVNSDATLDMLYHIDWMVLDSTSEGPLSWVEIGIPNRHYSNLRAISPAVKKVSESGDYVRVDLNREYFAGEVAQIEFSLTQDYMYQMDELTEGETVYHFTPGWFDGIRVDLLTIRWNADGAIGQTPSCLKDGGYYEWTASLAKGEKYSVSVTYPDDAFGFDASKSVQDSGDEDDLFFLIIGVFVFLLFFVGPILAIIAAAAYVFNRGANFSDGTKKKITRTKVVYYPTCPGCGAPRPEGKDNCEYCGRSFIKSEEVLKEEDIPAEERDLRRKETDGLYRYSSQPNTYVRVHVTHIPVPVSHSSHSSRGSSHRSSCAHSSCACACACACAGGGRAGCTVKDFYNTDLKLRQLAARKRER